MQLLNAMVRPDRHAPHHRCRGPRAGECGEDFHARIGVANRLSAKLSANMAAAKAAVSEADRHPDTKVQLQIDLTI